MMMHGWLDNTLQGMRLSGAQDGRRGFLLFYELLTGSLCVKIMARLIRVLASTARTL